MSKKNKRARAPTLEGKKKFVASGYSEGGASRTSNILKTYNPVKLSAKSDIDTNLYILRNRAADMAINTPIGASAINTSVTHTVGAGLKINPRPKQQILGIDAKTAREWTRRTIEEFNLWASTVDCDICRRNNFYDLQNIAYTSYLTDGDAFALFKRKRITPRNPYTLRLQLLEANRVSNPLDGTVIGVEPYGVEVRAANGNRIVNGVEVNNDGEVIAYYVSNRVPNDLTGCDEITKWVRVKAFGELTGLPNVLQVCRDTRPGQFRGVPYLAPVIESLKQTSRYTTAELASAIVKAFFSLFFVQSESNRSLNEMLPYGARDEKAYEPVVDVREYNLGSGTLNALPKGVDVKAVDGGKSQSAFAAFTQELVKQIGSAINIPYELLMKSFTASYSASRAALLQAAVEFKQRREWFARDFCQPIYETWLIEAIASGRIEAPGFFDDPLIRAAWSNAEWFAPVMGGQIDPIKEIQGAQLRISLGLSTHEKEAAELCGTDFAENIEKLLEEQKMMEELQPEPTETPTETEETDDNGDMEAEEDVQQRTDNE